MGEALNQNNIKKDKLFEIINLQTEVVQQGIDLGNIMELVTRRSEQITNSDGASIELIEKQELVYSAASGIAEKFLGFRLNIDSSLSGECIRTKEPLISNNIETDDRVNKEACRRIGISSMIVVPLIYQNNVVGILKVMSKNTDNFGSDDIGVLELMSGLVAAAMFNAMQNDENELFYKATHDNLTGIPNRAVFYERLRGTLSTALKTQSNFGIISLDMDGLKGINDTYGHRAGDAAILEIAKRVKASLTETDLVARLGGDEFAIVVANIADREKIQTLIRQIDSNITMPFEFEGNPIKLRASIGYALFSEDGIEMDILIEKADKSMYEVKRNRKGSANVR